jgi:hypothetical protein
VLGPIKEEKIAHQLINNTMPTSGPETPPSHDLSHFKTKYLELTMVTAV